MTKRETGQLQLLMPKYLALSLLAIGLAWIGVSSEGSGEVVLSPAAAQATVAPANRDGAAIEEGPGRDAGTYPDPFYMGREPHDDGGYFYYGTACCSSGHVDQIGCL